MKGAVTSRGVPTYRMRPFGHAHADRAATRSNPRRAAEHSPACLPRVAGRGLLSSWISRFRGIEHCVIPSVARDLGGRGREDRAARPRPPKSLATLGMTTIAARRLFGRA